MILGAAPAVPLVGIPALLTLAFVTFVAALAAWGTLKLFDYTLGLLLEEVAELVDSIWFVGGFGADKIRRSKNYMRGRIADAAMALDSATARFWQGAKDLTELTYDVLYEFGGDVYDTLHAFREVTIPQSVTAGTAPIDRRLDSVNRRTRAAEQAEAARRAQGIDAVRRDLLAEKLAREQGIDATITQVLGRIRAGEQALTGQIADVWGYARRTLGRRLSRMEALVLGGALTAVAVRALDARFPFWKCTNVRNFNRGLCRAPVGALDWLFGLAALAVVALDPRAVARAAQEVVEQVDGLLRELADV